MAPRRTPSTPPEIPGYQYSRMLGSGGFADVFLYQQWFPRRFVAVKVLLAESLTPAVTERFHVEANLMAQLSHHPSIVTIYQADIASDRRPYLVMEYCSRPGPGAGYRREITTVQDALRTGIRLASAVETAHRAGILHRDIKPANILTTDFGWPALTDFGIASSIGRDGSEAVGMSIPWSPPELLVEQPTSDARGDIFSLAATIYSLLAQRSPFEVPGGSNGPADLIARIERSPLQAVGRPDVPFSLGEVFNKAMAKDMEARYRTALELARAFQHVEEELGYPVTTVEISEITASVEEFDAQLESDDEDDPYTRIQPIVLISPDVDAETRGWDAFGDQDELPDSTVMTKKGRSSGPSAPLEQGPVAQGVGAQGFPASAAPSSAQGAPFVPAEQDVDHTRMSGAGLISATPPATSIQGGGPQPTPTFQAPSPRADSAVAPAAAPIGFPSETTGSVQSGRGRRGGGLVGAIVAGVVVVCAVVGIGWAVLGREDPKPLPGPTQSSGAPAINTGAVPIVTDLVGVLAADGSATFTWSNPDPQSGDQYLWGVVDISQETQLALTDKPTITVPPSPDSTKVCIQVELVRSDRRASKPAQACAS